MASRRVSTKKPVPAASALRRKPQPPPHPLENRKAPPFKLPDGAGAVHTLKDLTGRNGLVLYFYPKDMTPGCTTEACAFRDSLRAIRTMGADVAGISGDSPRSHLKFADRHGLNFTLLCDEGNRVAKLYGVYKKKALYGRQFMGIERTTFLIDKDGRVRRVFPKVKVKGHVEEVIEAIGELA